MNDKFSNIFSSMLFIVLLIEAAIIPTELKNGPPVLIILSIMLLFGILALASFFAKPPFKIPILFYVLLATLLSIDIFILSNYIVSITNPDDGWIVIHGERYKVMSRNWKWGIHTGIALSLLMMVFYHKFVKRNRYLEISFITIFIIILSINFIIKAILYYL